MDAEKEYGQGFRDAKDGKIDESKNADYRSHYHKGVKEAQNQISKDKNK